MPQNFLNCDRDQPMLLPPDLRDWLLDDHLAWFVIDAVAELDLEPFYASYRADGHGAAAHDPKMMDREAPLGTGVVAQLVASPRSADLSYQPWRGRSRLSSDRQSRP